MAIGVDLVALAGPARWPELSSEAVQLSETAGEVRFPGALFPALPASGELVIYGVANSLAEWRKLQPLLLAFAGPTLTDFTGTPSAVDASDPVEGLLLAGGATVVAKLRPGTFPHSREILVRALTRLRLMLAEAPDLAVARPEPTVRLLSAFQDALNGGDVGEAWRLQAILREELRLDAVNLTQLEMQILAVAENWIAIRWHGRFESLALSGPSPATAEILLEAIYWSVVYDGEAATERPVAEFREDEAWPYVAALLRLAPTPSTSAVERLRTLATPLGMGPAKPVSPEPASTVEVPDPLARAQAAFLAVAAAPQAGDPATDAALHEALDMLEPEAQAGLLARPLFRAIWAEVLARTGTAAPPADWHEWLSRLGDTEFDAMAVARQAATDWRLPDAPLDPAVAERLARQISETPTALPEERLGEALPYFVQWAQADPRWPREGFRAVYVELLVRTALSARRGEAVLRSAARLFEGALRCGLGAAQYRDVLDAIETIAFEGVSRANAYDVLELVDVARSVSPSDPARLQSLIIEVVGVLQSVAPRLSEGQQIALLALAQEFGLAGPAAAEAAPTDEGLRRRLARKVVGIYTLTETAGRQAEAIMRSTVPDIVVNLNHDHAASGALAALVARSDLVVVTWASAKHAATEFIKARRGARPLVYAAGRGASSIVRAIEDWVRTEGPAGD
ncbi:protein DpdD [Mesorhizobium sp.]|uniref:protein DpdD n=1 Tax=Mesorhizobium sp. TaxID=1871066 RepID=UPI000FE82130|nr:protein DpdD [Mesorhizobium sp.]RWO55367.1 MAG: hypothetical protein EOS14_29965 [Mesorhizobium sp.]